MRFDKDHMPRTRPRLLRRGLVAIGCLLASAPDCAKAAQMTLASASMDAQPHELRYLQQFQETIVTNISDPRFFQELREAPFGRPDAPPPGLLMKNVTYGGDVVANSQIYKVTVLVPRNDSIEYPDDKAYTYRLADLKAFLPFSVDAQVLLPTTLNDAFAAQLALYHFNNPEDSPILNHTFLEEHCPDLKLTMELLDSEFSPIQTTRLFTDMLQRAASYRQPPAAGVIGAFRSAVTSPLATLTSVNNLIQVSAASTAVEFDVKEQYPLFGRTVTSSVGEAQVAASFFQSIGSTHVVILYVTDYFGSSLQKAFQDAATAANIVTESVAFSFDISDIQDAKQVMQQLKKIQYRHVYAIFFEKQFDPLMQAAIELGAAGPDYLYVFPGLDVNNFRTFKVNASSPVAKAYNGAGLIQMQGGIVTEGFIAGQSEVASDVDTVENFEPPPIIHTPNDSGFEAFRQSWTKALHDVGFAQHVVDSLPKSLDVVPGFNRSGVVFDPDPGTLRPFLYDAVTSMGLAMCSSPSEFFTGEQVFEEFLQTDFEGASGRVLVSNRTGTRDYQTIAFSIWNTRVEGADADGNAIINVVPSLYFQENRWKTIPGNDFVFADGKKTAPKSLPDALINDNYIGDVGRIVGYTLMGITCFSSVLSILWFFWYQHEHVVASSQPLFLLMVSFGTIVMSSTIAPLGMEETTADQNGLSMACMAAPWLYILGTTIAFSALFAKTKGVHRAYLNPELDFIHVSAFDIFFFFLIYFLLNFIVLITWTIVSPLIWVRQYDTARDLFNREIESFAKCESDNSIAFVIVLALINFGMLILGNWWAYKARNIETEYNESSYIGVSMAAVLQAWAMGVPILIVVWNSPPAKYYVSCGIIFVTSQAVLSLVYIPKMLALRKAKKEGKDSSKRKAYASFQERSKPQFDDEEDENTDSNGVRQQEGSASADDVAIGVMAAAADVEQNPQEPLDDNGDVATRNSAYVFEKAAKSDAFASTKMPSSDSPTRHDKSKSWSPAVAAAETQSRRRTRGSDRSSASSIRSALSNSLKNRGSIFVGAVSSKDVPENLGGVKVLHNPRASENLEIAGGLEVSRKQLDYFREEAANSKDERKDSINGRWSSNGEHDHSHLAADQVIHEEGDEGDEDEEAEGSRMVDEEAAENSTGENEDQ